MMDESEDKSISSPAKPSEQPNSSVQNIQNILQQNNNFVKEHEVNALIKLAAVMEKNDPALAHALFTEMIEVSKSKRALVAHVGETIRIENAREFKSDIIDTLASVFALSLILAAIAYATYLQQPWIVASVAGFTATIVVCIRLGKKAKAPIVQQPKKNNRDKKK